MNIDPRNCNRKDIISSDNKFHTDANICKTLTLLRIVNKDNKNIYFICEGVASWCSYEELKECDNYFYNEHTCPTNFSGFTMISCDGDHDPHGIFEFVESVWMTKEYNELGNKANYLLEVFPILKKE
jgi:hypothetical protein